MRVQQLQVLRAGHGTRAAQGCRATWAAVAFSLLALQGPVVHAGAPGAAAPSLQSAASGPSRPSDSKVAQAGSRRAAAAKRSGWTELSADQQQALRPLADTWPTLSEAQRRKWIALSRNYRHLSPDDQALLHSRMNGWAALSPQQRTQARLNFAETRDLSADDKKAKWAAYQALPAEEKRKLAAKAPLRTPRTAAAVKPVPAQKLAKVPRSNRKAKSSRMADGPAAQPTPEPGSTAPGSQDD